MRDPQKPNPDDIPSPVPDPLSDDDDGGPILGEPTTLTPAAPTRITLNPKVSGEPTDLQCPVCEELIEAVEIPKPECGNIVEYRCGCDKLRQFRVRGPGDGDE